MEVEKKRSSEAEDVKVDHITPTESNVVDPWVAQFETRDAEWEKEATKKLVRKVDTRLLPFLVVMYLLNFLDRANLAQARQGSLESEPPTCKHHG